MKTFSSASELDHTRLAKQIWKIRRATFVSPSRFAVEKKKKKKIMAFAKLFALPTNAITENNAAAINESFRLHDSF